MAVNPLNSLRSELVAADEGENGEVHDALVAGELRSRDVSTPVRTTPRMTTASGRRLTFVDLFAGCGGLSLGLCQAGLQGVFAIERDPMAFSTFQRNFLGNSPTRTRFDWPSWLESKNWAIADLLRKHPKELAELAGTINVVAGGPPCQGFSFSGKRRKSDPRNRLFQKYVEFVGLVRPEALIIENVPGMRVAHRAPGLRATKFPGPKPKSFYAQLISALEVEGYTALGKVLDASSFGVPQRRPRLVVIGIRSEFINLLPGGIERAFELVEIHRLGQVQSLGFKVPVSASEAISDLESAGKGKRPCVDPESRGGFEEATYVSPSSGFQKLMHGDLPPPEMDSMRLVRHHSDIVARFSQILRRCPRGVRMDDADRAWFGLLKHRIYPMAPDQPAPTITTLPDDVLHYSEPRVLTVRESARLQSFPDWFVFRGKFTTGGNRRTQECPRYTQIGNAVPPLLASVLGGAIVATLHEAKCARSRVADSDRRHVAACT